MTKKLHLPPKIWLNPKICEKAYEYLQTLHKDLRVEPFKRNQYQGRLESILSSVQQTFGGKHLNPTVLDAATAYFFQFICGHALYTGNKRLGVIVTHLFLFLNEVDIKFTRTQLYTLAILVAKASEYGIKDEKLKSDIKEIFSEYSIDLQET